MDFIIFLVIGAVAGWLAGLIFRGGGYGLLWNIIIGIVGGVIGGWLLGPFLANVFGEGLIGGIITAVVGSIVLLWIASMIKKK
jgi:uncharacterized membrane protein YeaQ/YmgE (transglycosylase-associated protein family)